MADLRHILALALALPLASIAPAQERAPPPATEGDVVVTGIRDPAAEARAFAQAITAAGADRQLSRFETRAVCPAAMGLSPDQKTAVVARLRTVAQAAGVPLAKPGCKPNVLLIVARDKQGLLRTLASDGGGYFASLTKRERRQLLDDDGPAAAWQLSGGLLSADGVELQQVGENDIAINRTPTVGSRITAATRPHFAAAAVVVQADALVGLTLTQLADYAAMRVFARTDPSLLAASTAPTILKVLDAPMGSETPPTLTRWDLGLLRGLYASSANLPAAAQRSEIARRVGDQVAPTAAKR